MVHTTRLEPGTIVASWYTSFLVYNMVYTIVRVLYTMIYAGVIYHGICMIYIDFLHIKHCLRWYVPGPSEGVIYLWYMTEGDMYNAGYISYKI
jgi:hypothetical protein